MGTITVAAGGGFELCSGSFAAEFRDRSTFLQGRDTWPPQTSKSTEKREK